MKSERHLPTNDREHISAQVLTISCLLVAGRPIPPILVRISDGSQAPITAPRAPRIFRAARKEDYAR